VTDVQATTVVNLSNFRLV